MEGILFANFCGILEGLTDIKNTRPLVNTFPLFYL